MNLSEREEAVGLWVGLLERAALKLAETKDWPSRVESDVAGLRVGVANESAKVEEVQGEAKALKVELPHCGPEMKKGLPKLEQEIKTTKPQPEPIAPPAADLVITPAPKADPTTRTSSNSNSPPSPNTVSAPSMPATMKASQPSVPSKPHRVFS